MVAKFNKKKGPFGWVYLEGKTFETVYITKNDYDRFQIELPNESIDSCFVQCVKHISGHNIIPGAPGFRFYFEDQFEDISLFCVLFQTCENGEVDVHIFDTKGYNLYLMTDKGSTIEKVL